MNLTLPGPKLCHQCGRWLVQKIKLITNALFDQSWIITEVEIDIQENMRWFYGRHFIDCNDKCTTILISLRHIYVLLHSYFTTL